MIIALGSWGVWWVLVCDSLFALPSTDETDSDPAVWNFDQIERLPHALVTDHDEPWRLTRKRGEGKEQTRVRHL